MKLSKHERYLIRTLRHVDEWVEGQEPLALTITLSRNLVRVRYETQGFQGNGEGHTFDDAYWLAHKDYSNKYMRVALNNGWPHFGAHEALAAVARVMER
jgi:hypothetical protein